MRALALWIVLTSRIAAAEHDATFAKHVGVAATAVRDVAGYELPSGNEMTHVLIGRYDQGASVFAGAVLLKCEAAQCSGRRADFGSADAIEIHGVVDLHGAPGPLPNRAIPATAGYAKVAGARDMKFPALILRTRERTPKLNHVRLYVISLLVADRASTVLQDTQEQRTPAGKATVRTYRLDREPDAKAEAKDSKTPLDIIATERRSGTCQKPTEQRFTLEDHHYRTKSYTPGTGC